MTPGAIEPTAIAYVVNQQARISAHLDDGRPGWVVEAPIAGEGLRTSVVGSDERPDLHAVFEAIGDGRADVDVDPTTVVALVDLGVLVGPSHLALPVSFAAPLPPADVAVPDPDRLSLNPAARLDAAPAGEPFEPGTTIEVVHPNHGVELAYWLDADQEATVADLLTGGRSIAELAPHDAGALHAIGVLVEEHRSATPRRLRRAPDRVARTGHVTLRSLLPPAYVQAIQQYVRGRVAQGFLPLGDAQSPRRYVEHNDALAVWLHARLLPVVQPMLPIAVRPSYSYLIAYLDGAVLPAHTDRAQCEYTVSLAVDASPDDSREGAWPLHLRTDHGSAAACRLAPGDAVLFAGRRLTHHRHALPDGHTSASLLLHFVDRSFAGHLE